MFDVELHLWISAFAECQEPRCQERDWNLPPDEDEGLMKLCHNSRLWLYVFVMLQLCGHFKGQPSRRGSIISTLHHFDTISSSVVHASLFFQCVSDTNNDVSVFSFTLQEDKELQMILISILLHFFEVCSALLRPAAQLLIY